MTMLIGSKTWRAGVSRYKEYNNKYLNSLDVTIHFYQVQAFII